MKFLVEVPGVAPAGKGAGRRGRRTAPPPPPAQGFDGYERKLSDALLDVAAPLVDLLKPSDAPTAERVTTLAAHAWNAELLAETRSESYPPLARVLRAESEAVREALETIRDRKRQHHKDDDRLVVGVEVTGEPPSFRFRAAGTSLRRKTFPPDPAK